MTQQQRDLAHQLLRDSPLDLGGDVHVQRPLLEQLLTAHQPPADVLTERVTLGGVPAVAIDIADVESEGVLLFFHGGVFALGSANGSVGLVADLARRTRMRAVTADYRLAPEHPFPAAIEDAVAIYRALVDQEGGPERIVIGGESAGANLAVATLLAAGAAGLPQPAAGLLMSPWSDLTVTGDSLLTKADADPKLTAAGLRIRALEYAAGADPKNPLISPIFADLTGLPPLLVQVGSHEVLLDDAIRLAARAASDDVAVTLDVTPGVPHVFQAFAAFLEEGDTALTRAAEFLRAQVAA
ncbi:alpha/beta hydrolase [Amycolatopsis sp. NPDC026612]|uniref:alpha/beta hydrolase n=1 Tax=Amycolatopsis sp. NPDC026612 TaxID=3155466 RepID=UPI0033DAA1B7